MAALVQSSTIGPGARTITPNTLTSSDTFVYYPKTGQMIIFYNGTAGSLTPTIGSGAGTASFDGVPSVTTTTYSVGAIAVGASKLVVTDTISAYLVNGSSPTIASGTGLTCWILQDF
jgi:hypothetical protein